MRPSLLKIAEITDGGAASVSGQLTVGNRILRVCTAAILNFIIFFSVFVY